MIHNCGFQKSKTATQFLGVWAGKLSVLVSLLTIYIMVDDRIPFE